MRNLAKKILRDRIMWVLARMMTPLLQYVDSRKGDTLSFTFERSRYTETGEQRERYIYRWSLEDNADNMYHQVDLLTLNDDTMELDLTSSEEREIDMDEFFDEKSHAGGWSKGRLASKAYHARPTVSDQRHMSVEQLLDIQSIKK